MRLGKIAVVAFSFQLLSFSLTQAAWQEPNFGPPWCSTSNNIGCSPPITASLINQVKVGGFGTLAPLSGPWVFAINKLGIGPGADSVAELDSTAVLDVDGQIRIRGVGSSLPGNKVLISNADGLAEWTDTLNNQIFWLKPGTGIVLTSTSTTDGECQVEVGKPPLTCRIDVATSTIQMRITGACADGAISEVKQDGTVTCQPLVNSITASSSSMESGLGINSGASGAVSGAVSLNIDIGNSGLFVAPGNILKVDQRLGGYGLTLANNYLKFDTAGCTGSSVYWKYNTTSGTWGCGEATASRFAGESIMYLKSSGTPPLCPALWADLLGGTLATEDPNPNWNKVRICWRNNAVCQTMYLTDKRVGVNSPACPAGWTQAAYSNVYPPDVPNNPSPAYYNKVRTCYKCN